MWILSFASTYNEIMPSRNIQRLDAPNSYYHVYTRGINKAAIFSDTDDKNYFYICSAVIYQTSLSQLKLAIHTHTSGVRLNYLRTV